MEKKPDNSLSRLERPRFNWPLVVIGIAVVAVLITGVIVSVRAGDWLATSLFIVAAAGFGLLTLTHVAAQRKFAAIDDRKFIRWDAAMPEVQRQNVNVEVRELARLLDVGGDQLTDLLSAYIVAEDLALRQIQQEENLPLLRHVSIGGTTFDAILVDRDLITCIEASFLVKPDIRQEKIEAIFKKVAQAKRNLIEQKSRLRMRLMLVLVTQLSVTEEEYLRSVLITQRFSDTPVDIDIRMLDFEMLQKVYVSE